MRHTSEVKEFPYQSSGICYLILNQRGELTEVTGNDHTAMKELYQHLIHQDCKLYAVWPKASSDRLYLVDDLPTFAKAFELLEPKPHIHEIAWSFTDHDDEKSKSAEILVQLKCGCKIRFNGLSQFAEEVKNQKGWIIDQSSGMSMSSQGEFSIYKMHVLRSSLRES